jgi:cytoskeletal protein CcmA (bactofilin family)
MLNRPGDRHLPTVGAPPPAVDQPVAEAPPVREPAVPRSSVVDETSKMRGTFTTTGDLRLLGTVAGAVECEGLLTVERQATVRAKVKAADLRAEGTIKGEVRCSGRLTAAGSAVLSGKVWAGALAVEDGASIAGQVEITGSHPAELAALGRADEDDEDARIGRNAG